MPSPYDVLGIDPDADEAELVDAYRERVKDAHPDHGGSPEQFQAVKTAYERIRDGEAEEPGPNQSTPTQSSPTPSRAKGRQRGSATTDSAASTATRQSETVTVEYLNYEVLDDYDWEIEDDDLFAKAARADLDYEDYGKFVVENSETLLEAAENRGFAWPFACRGGACTNCAVAVKDGEIPPPVGHILPEEMIEKGIRLSCLAAPVTDDTQVVYNVKHMPGVEELLLSPSRFEKAHSD